MNLAFLGDSTIAGVDGAIGPADGNVYFCTPLTAVVSVSGYSVVNLGVGGQTLAGVLAGSGNQSWGYQNHTIKSLAGHVADLEEDSIVVIEAGINDAFADNGLFADDVDETVEICAGQTLILMTPLRVTDGRVEAVAEKAKILRGKAKEHGLPLIDVQYGMTISMPAYSYGAHPDANGYAVIGAYADKRIKQILDPNFPAFQRRAALVAAIGA